MLAAGWNLSQVYQSSIYTCLCSLGFLTAWQPHGGWTFYMVVQGSKGESSCREDKLCILLLSYPLKSHCVTVATFQRENDARELLSLLNHHTIFIPIFQKRKLKHKCVNQSGPNNLNPELAFITSECHCFSPI
jgi:hypothetical protein